MTTFQPNQAARTTDGGATWATIPIPSSPRLAAIEYIPGTEDTYSVNDGFFESSNLLLTTDGSMSWETISHPPSMDCMQFISPTIGFGGGAVNVSDNSGLYKWTGNLSDSTFTSTKKIPANLEVVEILTNPASSYLAIKTNNSLEGSNTLKVEIFSGYGQLALSKVVDNKAIITIPIGNLPNGIYLLCLRDKSHYFSRRFVKQ